MQKAGRSSETAGGLLGVNCGFHSFRYVSPVYRLGSVRNRLTALAYLGADGTCDTAAQFDPSGHYGGVCHDNIGTHWPVWIATARCTNANV